MASGQRCVQWLKSKRCWRFRRRVPGHLRELIGKTEWIEILPARNRTEAERLAIPYIDETNRIIQLAEGGNWPPIGVDEIEVLAIGWWEWFRGEPLKRWIDRCGGNEPLDHHDYALAGEDDLSRSIRRFLAGPLVWQYPRWLRPKATQAKIEAILSDPKRLGQLLGNADAMTRLKRQCRVLHHEWVGGFLGEIDDRKMAVAQIMSAIHAQNADPLQIAGAIAGQSIPLPAVPAHTETLLPQAPPALTCNFRDLIDSWAAERKHITPKSVYEVEHIAGKLAKFLGHEEPSLEARLIAALARQISFIRR
jgi:hypothetical protein